MSYKLNCNKNRITLLFNYSNALSLARSPAKHCDDHGMEHWRMRSMTFEKQLKRVFYNKDFSLLPHLKFSLVYILLFIERFDCVHKCVCWWYGYDCWLMKVNFYYCILAWFLYSCIFLQWYHTTTIFFNKNLELMTYSAFFRQKYFT